MSGAGSVSAADAGPPAPSGRGDGPDASFVALWERLGRPFSVVPTVAALLGLPSLAVARVVGTRVASGPEAHELLTTMPATVRSLATSMKSNNERCIGELRGPVLWSETISARASSFGDPDLFVCATPTRAYDIDENQVLVAALKVVADAGRAAVDRAPTPIVEPRLDVARRAGAEASRWMDHPSLTNVSRQRPGKRAVRRTRSGKHRASYGPALRVLEIASEPLSAAEVDVWRDVRTRAQHTVLMGLVERLEAGGRRLPDLRVERGALLAGPMQYRHNRHLGDTESVSGISLGGLLVDVPARLHDPDRARAEAELAARSGGRPSMVVMGAGDLDLAVVRAVELAARRS